MLDMLLTGQTHDALIVHHLTSDMHSQSQIYLVALAGVPGRGESLASLDATTQVIRLFARL